MKLTSLTFVVMIALASTARAQDATGTPAQSTDSTVVDAPPGYPTAQSPGSYEEYRKQELQRGIKRTRTALIITSASFAVGLSLVVPAFTSDNCVQNEFNDNFRCTTTGKALLGVGWPFLAVGFWGALVSGIMLGVRKGKVRRLDEKIAYQSRAKFRFDPERGAFVF